MVKALLRNLLVGFGAYQLSWWVAYPLAQAYWKLTDRITYHGDFASAFFIAAPYALVAVGVGACVAWLVESERPFRWATFPAALYIYFDIIGYHWAACQPLVLDRVPQILGAIFMGITCLLGAMLVAGQQGARRHQG
jgi:hypothetical protein